MAIDPLTGKEQVTGITQEAKHLANLKKNPGGYTGVFGSSDTTANNRVKAAEANIRPSQEATVAPMSLADLGKQEDIENKAEFANLESDQQNRINKTINDPSSPLYGMNKFTAYGFLKRSGNLGPITSFSEENNQNQPFNISDILSNTFGPGGINSGRAGIGTGMVINDKGKSVPGSGFNVGFNSQDRGNPGLAGLQTAATDPRLASILSMFGADMTDERKKELTNIFEMFKSFTSNVEPQRIGPQTQAFRNNQIIQSQGGF